MSDGVATTRMRAILGIDAAWTTTQPSGVALVVERAGRWACAAVAPSYAEFLRLGAGEPVDWLARGSSGGEADEPALLGAARRLAPGAEVCVVAVDMPLATGPIVGRRVADDAVTRAFGGRGCGTHSPSARRPGPIADRLRAAFAAAGYELATTTAPAGERSLVEVYPHTALLALLQRAYRVAYKASRARRYWPDASPPERRTRLLGEWSRILEALEVRISGIDLPLPEVAPAAAMMKRYEDALDALVCAWVGIELLAGRAEPHGDGDAAIWVPTDRRATGRPPPRRPLPKRGTRRRRPLQRSPS